MPAHRPALDDALLAPTRVYVRAAEALWEAGVITARAWRTSPAAACSTWRGWPPTCRTTLDALPPAPPVFALIAEAGRIPPETMYATFNMGTGFCVVVSPAEAQAALAALKSAGEEPVVAGSVTGAPRPLRVDPGRRPARPRRRSFPPGGRPPR